MPSIFDWSSTAGSNTTVDGVNIAESCPAANINNAIRSVMALCRATFASALQSFLAGSAALPIANGGTAATSAAAALTSLGALDDDYRDLVPITKNAAFTFANAERGNGIRYTGAAAAATINPNATTAINTGAVYVIFNNGSGDLTLTRGAGVTLYKNGGTTDANVIISVGGECSLKKWNTDLWTVTGSGIA